MVYSFGITSKENTYTCDESDTKNVMDEEHKELEPSKYGQTKSETDVINAGCRAGWTQRHVLPWNGRSSGLTFTGECGGTHCDSHSYSYIITFTLTLTLFSPLPSSQCMSINK